MAEGTREHIAARLRVAREAAGLSQGQVAKLMGLHRPTISEIEAGRRRVTGEELVQFAKLLPRGRGLADERDTGIGPFGG